MWNKGYELSNLFDLSKTNWVSTKVIITSLLAVVTPLVATNVPSRWVVDPNIAVIDLCQSISLKTRRYHPSNSVTDSGRWIWRTDWFDLSTRSSYLYGSTSTTRGQRRFPIRKHRTQNDCFHQDTALRNKQSQIRCIYSGATSALIPLVTSALIPAGYVSFLDGGFILYQENHCSSWAWG